MRLGVRKLRLTGGEPLVRRNIMNLFRGLARHLERATLDELTLTTNGSQLSKYASGAVRTSGSGGINVSIDTLDPHKFQAITRWGKFEQGDGRASAAKAAGLAVKINAVALRGVNDDEFDRMVAWCGKRRLRPHLHRSHAAGRYGRRRGTRVDQYLPLSLVRAKLAERWTLEEIDYRTGGPGALRTGGIETGGRLGFITPLTHNFCESCNRVRLTCSGTLYMCLGQEDAADLRAPLRLSDDDALLDDAIREAIARKPKGHDFVIDRRHRRPAVGRHMSVTGG